MGLCICHDFYVHLYFLKTIEMLTKEFILRIVAFTMAKCDNLETQLQQFQEAKYKEKQYEYN